jgi:beta-mannosidase
MKLRFKRHKPILTLLLSGYFIFFIFNYLAAQTLNLNTGWEFRDVRSSHWLPATVPGSVYIDLMNNNILVDPFYADLERNAYWVNQTTWEYRCIFTSTAGMKSRPQVILQFEGLDTYATVQVNGHPLGATDNMFHPWRFDISPYLQGRDTLIVRFDPVLQITDKKAASFLPLRYPDNNRVFTRKAAYQFGWDWGPALPGAGIWEEVYIFSKDIEVKAEQIKKPIINSDLMDIRFHQDTDSIGRSFYFTRSGKPIYVQGANWIPSSIYPGTTSNEDYRLLLTSAKEAGVQMLRVWGGGIYEKDIFYDLCDSLGIMVWQDFMFAGAMYPTDSIFLSNVKNEVKYQVQRLSHHPCIVLWCGNNEIDEAWHHWGWQKSFNLHDGDSVRVWQDYVTLFRDSLPQWVQTYDPTKRPYISTSPLYGWGNPSSMTTGDSHYWGFWWGMQDWEIFRTKTGRFVSEWGMQSLPTYPLLKKYIRGNNENYNQSDLNAHQKANQGNIKLKHYLNKYFIDSTRIPALSLELYAYLSNAAQYYLLKNILLTHQAHYPRNMGSVLWQYNDCWPAISWSITDFGRSPKGGWYALRSCRELNSKAQTDSIYPKDIHLKKPNITITKINDTTVQVHSDMDARYVYLTDGVHDAFWSDNYFDLSAGESKIINLLSFQKNRINFDQLKVLSLWDVFHAAGIE